MSEKPPSREERLAQALRDNLKRRKEGAQAGGGAKPSTPEKGKA